LVRPYVFAFWARASERHQQGAPADRKSPKSGDVLGYLPAVRLLFLRTSSFLSRVFERTPAGPRDNPPLYQQPVKSYYKLHLLLLQ
jgi:hypothetical protein